MIKKYVGIDLGGTSMKIGVIDATGQLLTHAEKPTKPEEGAEGTIERMSGHIREIVASAGVDWPEIDGIGLGLPGFLDLKQGIVVHLTNLHWNDVPIRKWLENLLNKPVAINNDANVAALGESWVGAGAGIDDLVCVTIGTGVGGGIIAGGQLIAGSRGFAGEIGHIQIDPAGRHCNCGSTGCLETVASATGMVGLAQEAIAAGEQTSLATISSLAPIDIFAAANQGDRLSQWVLDQAIHALALGFAHLSVMLNPQLFVVGGGVANAGDALFVPLRSVYKRVAQQYAAEGVAIIPARLGNQAGIIGAAGLVALSL